MTDHRQDPTTTREDLERFRDNFGRTLIAAARQRDDALRAPSTRPHRGRRRGAAIGLAAAFAAAVVAVAGLPSPGDGDAPLLGATPAEAAVQELRRSLREGVLVRRAETTKFGRAVERRTQEDWTDLATREQHTRLTGGGPQRDFEYWNPSEHERWTRTQERAPDGRRIVEHLVDEDQSNISSTESPAEEVDELLRQAGESEVVVLRRSVTGGRKIVVLESRQRCFETPDGGAGMCEDPEKPSSWPQGAPARMLPVTNFSTWWLQEGDTPRMLRHENGSILHGSTERRVSFRIRYTRWDVLPTTAANLALVRPPAFPADQFLIREQRGMTGD